MYNKIDSETIIFKAKKSLFIFIVPILLFIILYAIYPFLGIFGLIVMIVFLGNYFSTIIIITDKRMVGHSGILNTYTIDLPIEKISGIVIEQSLFGRLLNYGDVKISSMSDSIVFYDIAKPDELKQHFYENK